MAALARETKIPGVGPIGAVAKLGDKDARRSTAFALEFARQFGATLIENDRAPGARHDGGHRDG